MAITVTPNPAIDVTARSDGRKLVDGGLTKSDRGGIIKT
jgi:fructose-1-phosphate kinase PfkB-like protein